MLTTCSPGRGPGRPRSPARRPASSLASTSIAAGSTEDAVRWFREAHRLAPDNWTYKRQAWTFADPLQGPTAEYDSDWLSEVRKIGAESYYPALEL